MRKTSPKPNVRYQVLGVALVAGLHDGRFRLEGFNSHGTCKVYAKGGPLAGGLASTADNAEDTFDPKNVEDARSRVLVAINRRQGQQKFRSTLLQLYGGCCAISGCDVSAALEAAHITPYKGKDTNTPQNGILLRSDLHTLWDLGLIGISSATLEVVVSRELEGTEYDWLKGKKSQLPVQEKHQPSKEALQWHIDWASLAG
jgi:predicted restriction endonuclease